MRDHIESKKAFYIHLLQKENSPFSDSTVGGGKEKGRMH